MTLELNKVHQMDCLEGMRQIEDKSVDMILCDLPYGTTDCAWDNVIPFEPLWEQYERVISDTGSILLFGSQPFTHTLINSNRKLFKYEWIWIKNKGLGFQHSKNMPIKRHENILAFSKAPIGHASLLGERRMNYNPVGATKTGEIGTVERNTHGRTLGARPKQTGRKYEKMTGFPTSLLTFDSDGILHPTQKPVALCDFLINCYTNEGDTVLDNCMGSGTTAVAAINTNRNFIGFEKEPKYVEICEQRINSALAAKGALV
jgi:site-specific DNA-methyltransferase (adenine-specific)